ncbi:MAG: helix-turn-helix domain-containing protein [Candidatus Woesearchaeota archaeon]
MKEEKILEGFGLTQTEAKVYITLLEIGSTLAGPIIKKTNLHRGTTYQILQRLIEKGLVSFVIKSGKRFFEAADPNRFLEILNEKQKNMQEILPTLIQKRKLSKEKQEVNVYSGHKGIKTVCENILDELKYGKKCKPNKDYAEHRRKIRADKKSGGEYLDFGVSGKFREIMGSYWNQWQRKKKKYRIKARCIFDESLKKESYELLKEYVGKARFHPKEFKSMTDTMIYNDKVVLFIWTAKPPIAVVIENKENAESYRNQFNLMWKHAKK